MPASPAPPVRDFDQDWPDGCLNGTAPASAVPNQGSQYCFPAAVLNWFEWLQRSGKAHLGVPSIDTLSSSSNTTIYSGRAEAIRESLVELGAAVGTRATSGTLPADAIPALWSWMNTHGLSDYVVYGIEMAAEAEVTPETLASWIGPGAMGILQVSWHAGDGSPGSPYTPLGSDHFLTLRSLKKKTTRRSNGTRVVRWMGTIANSSAPGKHLPGGCKQTKFQYAQLEFVHEEATFLGGVKRHVCRPASLVDAAGHRALVDGLVVIADSLLGFTVGRDIEVVWHDGSVSVGPFPASPPGATPVDMLLLSPTEASIALFVRSDDPLIYRLDVRLKTTSILARLDGPAGSIEFAGPRAHLYASTGDRVHVLDRKGARVAGPIQLRFPCGALAADTLRHRLYAVSDDGLLVHAFEVANDPGLADPAERRLPAVAPPAKGPRKGPPRPGVRGAQIAAAVDPRNGDLVIHKAGSSTVQRVPAALFERDAGAGEVALPPPLSLATPRGEVLRSMRVGLGGKLLFSAQSKKGTRLAVFSEESGREVKRPGLALEIGDALAVSRPYNGYRRPTAEERRLHKHVPPKDG